VRDCIGFITQPPSERLVFRHAKCVRDVRSKSEPVRRWVAINTICEVRHGTIRACDRLL